MIGNAFALLSLVDNVFQDADNGYICFIIFWNFYGLEAILVEGLEFYLRMNFYPVIVRKSVILSKLIRLQGFHKTINPYKDNIQGKLVYLPSHRSIYLDKEEKNAEKNASQKISIFLKNSVKDCDQKPSY